MAGLTNKAYAAELRKSINLEHATKSADVSAGKPPSQEGDQTTHFSIMDRAGNAVANTYTLNLAFGSGYTVDGAGFFLNNEMDDFSAKAGAPNAYGLVGDEANAIEPGKRPLSSMAPTIVLKDGTPYLITGSPGGSTIITVVLQEILNVLTFDMNVAEATAAPRVHHQWQPDNVITERGISDDTLRILEARGFILPKNADGTLPAPCSGARKLRHEERRGCSWAPPICGMAMAPQSGIDIFYPALRFNGRLKLVSFRKTAQDNYISTSCSHLTR